MDVRARWAALFAATLLSISAVVGGPDTQAPIRLRLDPQLILEVVASRLDVALRPEVAFPAILVASSTPLAQFQAAIGKQWRIRPQAVVNAYAIAKNEIYLLDDPGYHRRRGRTLDESLAHEFVHYIQVRYWGQDLSSDECELQAVAVQRWFREVYLPAAGHSLAANQR